MPQTDVLRLWRGHPASLTATAGFVVGRKKADRAAPAPGRAAARRGRNVRHWSGILAAVVAGDGPEPGGHSPDFMSFGHWIRDLVSERGCGASIMAIVTIPALIGAMVAWLMDRDCWPEAAKSTTAICDPRVSQVTLTPPKNSTSHLAVAGLLCAV